MANLASEKLTIEFDPGATDLQAVRSAVGDAGYTLALPDTHSSAPPGASRNATVDALRSDLILSVAFGLPVMILGMISMTSWFAEADLIGHATLNKILFLLTVPVVFLPGRTILTAGCGQQPVSALLT